MKPSEITKIIEEEINGNWNIENLHGIDIKKCLVTPPVYKVFEDYTQREDENLKYKEIRLWLVLEEDPDMKSGYKIIYEEESKKFGLAINGQAGRSGLIGLYGSFINTLQAM